MATSSISPANRIRELSAINADLASMVQHAGQAIDALTDRPLRDDNENDDMQIERSVNNTLVGQHKEAFTTHAKAYYGQLQAVVARLRRQAYALEEAGIIAAEPPTLSTSAPAQTRTGAGGPGRPNAQTAAEPERITNGGLGNLDVGWLNSRGNKVAAQKEAELMAEAKALLENALNK